MGAIRTRLALRMEVRDSFQQGYRLGVFITTVVTILFSDVAPLRRVVTWPGDETEANSKNGAPVTKIKVDKEAKDVSLKNLHCSGIFVLQQHNSPCFLVLHGGPKRKKGSPNPRTRGVPRVQFRCRVHTRRSQGQ